MEFSNDMERRDVQVPKNIGKKDAAAYKKKFGFDPINEADLRAFQKGETTRAEILNKYNL